MVLTKAGGIILNKYTLDPKEEKQTKNLIFPYKTPF